MAMNLNKHPGKLFIISGPSGAGKGTIANRILQETALEFSVSMTTRKPREGEIDGVHYHFLTRERFEALIAEDAFLEHAEYNHNYYGTLRAPIDEHMAAGQDVILEIEVKGASQIRALRPDASLIFIVPPSTDVLRERLINRGTEERDVIEQRVALAAEELQYAPDYDYVVVNDDLDTAIADFCAVVRAVELKNIK